jgi:hypothetical protein
MNSKVRTKTVCWEIKNKRGSNWFCLLKWVLTWVWPPVLDWPWLLLSLLLICFHINQSLERINIVQFLWPDTQFHQTVPSSAHFTANWGWNRAKDGMGFFTKNPNSTRQPNIEFDYFASLLKWKVAMDFYFSNNYNVTFLCDPHTYILWTPILVYYSRYEMGLINYKSMVTPRNSQHSWGHKVLKEGWVHTSN